MLLHPFPRTVESRAHGRTHLDIIVERQVVDRVSVHGTLGGVLLQRSGPLLVTCHSLANVIGGVVAKQLVENPNIFKSRVHSLAVERDHRVRGISEDDARVVMMIGRTLDGYQREMRIAVKLALKGRWGYQIGDHSRKVPHKELFQEVGSPGQLREQPGRQEERTGESVVLLETLAARNRD